MSKKEALFLAAADMNNFKYAVSFWNSMTKFHSPKDVDMIFFTDEKRPEMLKKIPQGIKIEDVTRFTKDDPMFWYRQKPIMIEPYLDDYELVVGFDVDQLILGDLSYLMKTKTFDVATVINWNRYDPNYYGFVDIIRLGIHPTEYFNCGLVALRSKKFAHHWKILCFSPNFERSQYREQDMLNVLCYFGNYNIRCLDHADKPAGMVAWWGMIGKMEWSRSIVRDNKIIVPQGEGSTPFPPEDMEIKVAHMGGGGGVPKDNWGAFFSEEAMVRINELIK